MLTRKLDTPGPGYTDMERVVDHFLHYLSNEPDEVTGISPRTRLYGMLPVESKKLFPQVSDETILHSVRSMLAQQVACPLTELV
jgi:hypothetical protein